MKRYKKLYNLIKSYFPYNFSSKHPISIKSRANILPKYHLSPKHKPNTQIIQITSSPPNESASQFFKDPKSADTYSLIATLK